MQKSIIQRYKERYSSNIRQTYKAKYKAKI